MTLWITLYITYDITKIMCLHSWKTICKLIVIKTVSLKFLKFNVILIIFFKFFNNYFFNLLFVHVYQELNFCFLKAALKFVNVIVLSLFCDQKPNCYLSFLKHFFKIFWKVFVSCLFLKSWKLVSKNTSSSGKGSKLQILSQC